MATRRSKLKKNTNQAPDNPVGPGLFPAPEPGGASSLVTLDIPPHMSAAGEVEGSNRGKGKEKEKVSTSPLTSPIPGPSGVEGEEEEEEGEEQSGSEGEADEEEEGERTPIPGSTIL